jgi:hypothetical protein
VIAEPCPGLWTKPRSNKDSAQFNNGVLGIEKTVSHVIAAPADPHWGRPVHVREQLLLFENLQPGLFRRETASGALRGQLEIAESNINIIIVPKTP